MNKKNVLNVSLSAPSNTTLFLESSVYLNLIDNGIGLNSVVAQNPCSYSNIGKSILSNFYLQYRNTVNTVADKFTDKEKESVLEPIEKVMNENEVNFNNSISNMMVNSKDDLDKLYSAVNTSFIFLDSEVDEEDSPENVFYGLLNSASHLFKRLHAYSLMPLWGLNYHIGQKSRVMWAQHLNSFGEKEIDYRQVFSSEF